MHKTFSLDLRPGLMHCQNTNPLLIIPSGAQGPYGFRLVEPTARRGRRQTRSSRSLPAIFLAGLISGFMSILSLPIHTRQASIRRFTCLRHGLPALVVVYPSWFWKSNGGREDTSTRISSIFGPTGKIKPFLTILVSTSLLVRVHQSRQRVPPQHHAAESGLTYREKFSILRS